MGHSPETSRSHAQHAQQSSGSKGKGQKGKGKGAGKDKGPGKLPEKLRVSGASGFDSDGAPICYSYNLGACTAAPPGGKCPRGRHVCILTRCSQAAHAYVAEHR